MPSPTPGAPPLNGRRIAEFYVASEVAKRTVLRAYAKPRDQQEARIILYDPLRKAVPDYFRSDRDNGVLRSVHKQLRTRQFNSREFTDTWYKSNASALAALRDFDFRGTFRDVSTERTSVVAARLRVISTVDFFARFAPKLGKARFVGVIVNPALQTRAEKRATWISIESEIAWQSAAARDIVIDEIMYVDLRGGDVVRYRGPKKRIWEEILATCERIARDWRDIRLQREIGEEPGTA